MCVCVYMTVLYFAVYKVLGVKLGVNIDFINYLYTKKL